MNIFAGKSPTERNKIIAASVLGIMALFSIYLSFGGSLFSRKTTVTVTASPSPSLSPGASPNQANLTPITVPDDEAIIREFTTTPIVYSPGNNGGAGVGRNIFAFYEPPPPTPYSPTPIPPEKRLVPPDITPSPTPPIMITFVNPQGVYAGSKDFDYRSTAKDLRPNRRFYLTAARFRPCLSAQTNSIPIFRQT